MILIPNTNIQSISKNYTSSITDEVMQRVQVLAGLITLLKSATVITETEIGDNYNKYRKALGPLLNIKKLVTKNKIELINNINNNRNNVDQRIDLVKSGLGKTDLRLRIEDLISSIPINLKKKQDDFVVYSKLAKPDEVFKYLFSYDDFYSDIISPIAKELGVVVCPYCNRSYITHVKGAGKKRIIGPTFDHFFHQAENPLLTLSFYNLIPSCSLCNSNLKNQKKFELEFNLHPYFYEMGNDACFDFEIKLLGTSKKKEVVFCPKIRIKVKLGTDKYKRLVKTPGNKDSGSLDVFKLGDIYASHYDTVEEVHTKFDVNSPHYVKSIADQLKIMGVGEDEFYRFHFGNYFKEDDFHKRPLAKLTKDIYNKMKAIAAVY